VDFTAFTNLTRPTYAYTNVHLWLRITIVKRKKGSHITIIITDVITLRQHQKLVSMGRDAKIAMLHVSWRLQNVSFEVIFRE